MEIKELFRWMGKEEVWANAQGRLFREACTDMEDTVLAGLVRSVLAVADDRAAYELLVVLVGEDDAPAQPAPKRRCQKKSEGEDARQTTIPETPASSTSQEALAAPAAPAAPSVPLPASPSPAPAPFLGSEEAEKRLSEEIARARARESAPAQLTEEPPDEAVANLSPPTAARKESRDFSEAATLEFWFQTCGEIDDDHRVTVEALKSEVHEEGVIARLNKGMSYAEFFAAYGAGQFSLLSHDGSAKLTITVSEPPSKLAALRDAVADERAAGAPSPKIDLDDLLRVLQTNRFTITELKKLFTVDAADIRDAFLHLTGRGATVQSEGTTRAKVYWVEA